MSTSIFVNIFKKTPCQIIEDKKHFILFGDNQ